MMAHWIQQVVKEYIMLSIPMLLCVGLSRSTFPSKHLLPFPHHFIQALPSPEIYQDVF